MLIDIWEFICDSINNTVTNTIGLMEEVILEIGKNSIGRRRKQNDFNEHLL